MNRNAILTMRPVDDDDQPFLYALFDQIHTRRLRLDEVEPELKAKVIATQFEAHREHYRSPEMDLTDCIILVDGEPVGRMIILQNGKEIRIADLAIDAAHRRKGIATAAIQGNIGEAIQSKRALRLHVAKFGDEDAARLYTRLGFVPIEDRGSHWFMEWRPGSGRPS